MINVDILQGGVQPLYDPLFTSLGSGMRLFFLFFFLLSLLLLTLLALNELSAVPEQCGVLVRLGSHRALQSELSVGVGIALELIWWLLNVLNLTG